MTGDRKGAMVTPFGVGIAGAGVISAAHARAIEALDGVRLVAVADPVEAASRALATSHQADWVNDAAKLCGRPDIDIVVLTTPSGLHAEQAIAAARAGKHIVSEKPMATTPEDADRMINAANEAGVKLAVIFQNRFHRDAMRLKRAMEAGLFGRPVLGNALVHWHRSQGYYDGSDGWRGTWALDGGGALMNQSIHTIDLLQWIMGPIERLSAETATLAHTIETEDTASAALQFTNGALGTIQGTTAAPADAPIRLEIVGTGGRGILEGGRLTVWEPEREVADDELLTDRDRELTEGWQADEPFGAAHVRQWRAIVAALRSGEEPPVPGAEARKAVEIIRAIYESAETGNRVTLATKSGELTS
ncbi:MAG TPA: Gfo/Idh/MocA family oxidoreductase [Thermomicrobiales bacterium]|nr:Gfo/Idh/MocA family oxidoreductase [Thermomicrobiales bacterium]